jgi:hypothetical protein
VAWDRAWHASRPFEDFWSPPHLFLYAMHMLAALTVARLLCWREGHAAFGPLVRVRPLPVRLPGPLLILAGGLLIVSLGGLLDGLWHARFGLDETGWSLPHALLAGASCSPCTGWWPRGWPWPGTGPWPGTPGS